MRESPLLAMVVSDAATDGEVDRRLEARLEATLGAMMGRDDSIELTMVMGSGKLLRRCN